MSYITADGNRKLPNYSGEWLLSDKQVENLMTHHMGMTIQLIQWLDSEYRLAPDQNANWLMLGQHMVELLIISDPRGFQLLSQRIIESMLKQVPPDNPFVAASLAEAGLADGEGYQKVLDAFLAQNAYGLFPFATGFLNLGDPFSTLWALRMMVLAGKQSEYEEKIEKAVEGLKVGLPDLEKTPDFIGFLLYVLIMLNRDKDRELIAHCADFLRTEATQWQQIDHNLRQGGFVAYDFLFACEHHPECMPIAERWLQQAFELSDEAPNGPPEPFIKTRKIENDDVPVNTWAQGQLRAMVAAALYLRLRRPDHTPSSAIVANTVILQNENSYLKNYFMSAKDFLPSLERIKSHQKELKTFWKKGQYEVSVFISRWMGKLKHGRVSPVAQSIVKAICEELKTVGLIGRYTGDHPKYSEHLWFNNEIYMRGCKYGIAVFEGMPECDEASCNTNHNVLVEAGVMWGKGANVLVVCDPKYARELPTDLNGIVRGDYDPNEEGLKQLRKEIHDWAEKIAEKEKESEEQTA